MATINHKVFSHHRKEQGLYNVKCVIYHNRKRVYISTPHNVSDRQVDASFNIKDKKMLATLGRDEEMLADRISKLGVEAARLTASELADRIYPKSIPSGHEGVGPSGVINFAAFSRGYIQSLKDSGRDGSARTLRAAINNLCDYFGSDDIDINSVTANLLRRFESYLATDRVQIRSKNASGTGTVTATAKGLDRGGIHRIMRDVRNLFNAARRHYNTEFDTPIKHYPFDFYRIPPLPKSRKKGDDLTGDDVRAIRDFRCRRGGVVELARDMFMLSLYLCGMNAKDIYDHDGVVVGGRMEYERSKTRGRRKDSAYISIKVPDQAAPLVDRYMSGYLRKRYSNYDGFISAISDGLTTIAKGNDAKADRYKVEGLGLDRLTYYHARHTFATTAHRECGYSTADVARALNHVDQSHQVTAGYIAYDWSVIDKMQSDVLNRLGL